MPNRREFLQTVPIEVAVYDTRFAESVAFAERGAALGLTVRAIEADMTRLWYQHVHPLWAKRPAAIAGLTAYGAMFCFAELARDVRMRIVFRAEHRGAAFGAAMADRVAHWPHGHTEMVVAAVGPVAGQAEDEALYTWVIAPASRG